MTNEETAIALACLSSPQHGYNIERQIISDTTGRIYIPSTSTYRLLAKLVGMGMIEAVSETNSRRTQYKTTHKGRVRLEYQASLYKSLARTISERLRD